MSYRDYYEVLGIARAASQDDVQKAYKKLARKWHPDVNREKDAEDRFKAINEAYEVLKDPKKRELYDKYGQAWKAISEGRQPPPGMENMQFDFRNMDGWTGGMDPSDLQSVFEQFFAGRRGRGGPQQRRARRGPMRGSDLESRIELGVEEGARGGTREIGIHDPSTGQVSRVSLKVPAGVRAGQRIRLAGKGGTGSEGAEAGDLYLQVELVDDARYRIEEDGVYTTVQIAPWEAALGATATIPTLDGEVRVKIPAGTSSGKNIRLRGKGYPQADGTRGDLYATVQIVVPDSLSSRERELFEQLRDASSFRARAE